MEELKRLRNIMICLIEGMNETELKNNIDLLRGKKMERNIIMNDKVETNLKNILEYMIESEERSFEESEEETKEVHIFKDVISLRDWFEKEVIKK